MEDDLLDPKDTLDMGFVLVSAVVGENDAIVDIVIVFRENEISKILAMSMIASFSSTIARTSTNPISRVFFGSQS